MPGDTPHDLELDDLIRRFAVPGQVDFSATPDGVILIDINNAAAQARVSLQGGQVLTFQPRGAAPVLWLSPEARFAPGKSIRGGIPVCWPWFGPHAGDPAKPAHGYVRTACWRLLDCSGDGHGTRLLLGLPPRPADQALWPPAAQVEMDLAVAIGPQLRVTLRTRNVGTAPVTLSQALHTYFNISDIAAVRVLGLEDCAYLDKVDGGRRKQQQGAITFDGELDRIYLDTTADCLIDDPGLQRRIRIAKQGSRSTVVWNPWIEKAQRLGDMGPEGYRRMLCVETANADADARVLAGGAMHELTTVISLL